MIQEKQMGQNVSISEQRDFDAHQRIPLGALRIISSTGTLDQHAELPADYVIS